MELSKSLYTRGLRCVKSLSLKQYQQDLLTPSDSSAQATLETGDRVGKVARELFPHGKEVPFERSSFEEKIALTSQWIDEGLKNIYEVKSSTGMSPIN